jgi:hypothetical protein
MGRALRLATLGVPVGGGGGWTPAELSGLLLWLDGSDATTLFQDAAGTTPAAANDDPVGLWMDKSGNANHATAADAARPALKTAAQNGLSVVQFGSTAHILALTASATFWNAVVVCAHTSATTFPTYADILGKAADATTVFGGGNGATTLYPVTTSHSQNRVGGVLTDEFAPLQTYKVIELERIPSGDVANVIGRTGTNTGRRWDGPIAEIILYGGDTAMTADEREALGLYLKEKWNVNFS